MRRTAVSEPDRPATLTVAQTAQLIDISLRSAYRAIEAGHIPVIRLGRRILVRPPASSTCSVSVPTRRPTSSGRRADVAAYFLVAWVDHRARDKDRRPTAREYGTASSKQAAIRLAERLLPPGAEYVVITLHRTVHEGRTPEVDRGPSVAASDVSGFAGGQVCAR
jgi:excisionase family DNA binding protein